jgi:hypothetical protein
LLLINVELERNMAHSAKEMVRILNSLIFIRTKYQ